MRTALWLIVPVVVSAAPLLWADEYCGVDFPAGVYFAEMVFAYHPGPGASEPKVNPGSALGAPECTAVIDTNVSLGTEGVLVLGFPEHPVTAHGNPLPDLVVFEVGDAEGMAVEISSDGLTWVSVGSAPAILASWVSDAVSPIDIDRFPGVVTGATYPYVRLTDLLPEESSAPSAGVDIDGVGAVDSVGPASELIWHNGVYDGSDGGFTYYAWDDFFLNEYRAADDIVLSDSWSSHTIEWITAVGMRGPFDTTDVTLEIWPDSGSGGPVDGGRAEDRIVASLPSTFSRVIGYDSPYALVEYTFAATGLELPAGKHWLGLFPVQEMQGVVFAGHSSSIAEPGHLRHDMWCAEPDEPCDHDLVWHPSEWDFVFTVFGCCTDPAVRLDEPVGGRVVKGGVPISGSILRAGDWRVRAWGPVGDGPAWSTIREDSILWCPGAEAGGLDTWDTGGLPDGQYEIELSADTCDGLLTSSTSADVIVDNSAPVVEITEPVANAVISGLVPVVGTAADANLDFWIVDFRELDDTVWFQVASGRSSVVADDLAVWDTRSLATGEYRLRVRSTDLAVNDAGASLTVTVQPLPPTIFIDGFETGDETIWSQRYP